MSHILRTAKKKVRDLPSTHLSVVNCASAGTLPAEAESLRPLQGKLNKRRGAPRDGEGQCAGCDDASEGYVSDVEVKLHDMHMHDQVFITKNDEHFEEIAMKQ